MSDLEGKLRELRNTMVDWTHCTPPFATNVVTEAAALGRAEGLERITILEEALEKLAKGNRSPGVLEIARTALKQSREG